MLANHDRLSRANPVRFICSSWIGTWVTDDRVTWRTTDCAWVAQLEPSANGRHIWMAFYHHGVYQPDVPFTGPRSLALAGALLVARAHAGPRREVGGTWKATHVDPDLGDQDLRHALSDARDGVQALELALVTMLVYIGLSIPLGVTAAVTRGKFPDLLIRFVSTTGLGVPAFWLGFLLQLVLSRELGWYQHPVGRLSPEIARPPFLTGLICGIRLVRGVCMRP